MTQIPDAERKTLILTGASRGIGHATVKRFSTAGWRVISCSRHPFPEDCPWDAGPEDHIQVDLAGINWLFEFVHSRNRIIQSSRISDGLAIKGDNSSLSFTKVLHIGSPKVRAINASGVEGGLQRPFQIIEIQIPQRCRQSLIEFTPGHHDGQCFLFLWQRVLALARAKYTADLE